MREYFIVEDSEMSECLDCGHESFNHAEYEVKGQEEAEVVCPNCKSHNFYIKEKDHA